MWKDESYKVDILARLTKEKINKREGKGECKTWMSRKYGWIKIKQYCYRRKGSWESNVYIRD